MKAERLAQVLHKATSSLTKVEAASFTDSFMSYITLRGYKGLLPRVLREYERLVLRESEEAVVVTVAKKSDVAPLLTLHQIEGKAITKIDETIIGGYHIETESSQIDATQKNALLTLYRNLTR
jgi:F0F1-type ATP synthase delta subunit